MAHEAEFRAACSRFPTGVTIATVMAADAMPCGMSVSSFTSVSLDPLLVLLCINHRAQMAKLLSVGTPIGINVLADGQQTLSERFSRNWHERFDRVNWYVGSTGVPLLADVVAIFECRIESLVPAGDHMIVIAQVLHAGSTEGKPLVYVNRSYARIAAGDERPPAADVSSLIHLRAHAATTERQ